VSQIIGYQDGIAGFVGWVRKISLGLVKYRELDKRPASLAESRHRRRLLLPHLLRRRRGWRR